MNILRWFPSFFLKGVIHLLFLHDSSKTGMRKNNNLCAKYTYTENKGSGETRTRQRSMPFPLPSGAFQLRGRD